MKKIFSKLTVNRREEFQIETSIAQSGDEKRVYKRALNEKAKAHVNRMYHYYCSSSRKEQLCPVHPVRDGEVYFDFISESSMNEALLECLKQKNMEGFQLLLQDYRQFVENSCELCDRPTEHDSICEEVFGIANWDFPGSYGRYLNIDLCFDNILLRNGQKIVIDYEWIFPFGLPVNFVIYRGIWALYIKNSEIFHELYTWAELYQSMGMTAKEVAVYEKMNERFNAHVYGGTVSYNQLLPQYEKSFYHIGEDAEQQGFLLQVFADDGEGYSEEKSRKIEISNQRVCQEIDVSMFKGASSLRVDPCNIPFVCKDVSVELENTQGEKYCLKADLSNGVQLEQGVFVFEDDDPQMIYHKQWKGEPEKLYISYQMEHMLKAEELELCRSIDSMYKTEIQRMQKDKNQLAEENAKLTEDKTKLTEEKITLLEDKTHLLEDKGHLLDVKHGLEKRLSETVEELMLLRSE